LKIFIPFKVSKYDMIRKVKHKYWKKIEISL
jgi:hypothetical protein